MKKLKIKLAIFVFKLLRLKCNKHIIGKVSYDENNNAHSTCQLCQEEMTLVGKTLGDIDKMTLAEVHALLTKDTSLENFAEKVNHISQKDRDGCKKCSGRLQLVYPRVELNNRTLFQCVDCNEREYLDYLD